MIVASACCKMCQGKDYVTSRKAYILLGIQKTRNVDEVAKYSGVLHSTVKRVFRQYNKTQSTSNQHANCGPKKILTDRDRRGLSVNF